MTTATIKDVLFQKEWNGMSIYKLTMSNGQSGDIFTKGWEPQAGQELTYTYDVEKSRIKKQNPNYQGGSSAGSQRSYSSGGGNKDQLISRQVALKAAVEFAAIHGLKSKETLQAADLFQKWILDGKEEAPAAPAAPAPAQYREQAAPTPIAKEEDDDLPF